MADAQMVESKDVWRIGHCRHVTLARQSTWPEMAKQESVGVAASRLGARPGVLGPVERPAWIGIWVKQIQVGPDLRLAA